MPTGCVRTGFSFAAEYVGSAKEKLPQSVVRTAHGRGCRGKGERPLFRACYTIGCPTPPPAGVASPMAKGVLWFLSIHVDLCLHRYILLRSGVDFRFVLVGWQDKRPAQDTRLTAGRRSIGYARRECINGQESFVSVATQECTDGNSM